MPTPAQNGSPKVIEGSISCETSQGSELHATPLRLSRHQVVFEVYTPSIILRVSEALSNFRIVAQERVIYAGRAVVTNLVNMGTLLVCEVSLEDGWQDVQALVPNRQAHDLRDGFDGFLRQWQGVYKVLPEYKVVISDMHMFLSDLRLWLDQVELGIRSAPSGDRIKLEQDLALELGEGTTRAIGELFERFEAVTEKVERELPDQRAAHGAFAKRLLHPLLLCAPFLYRTFRKPLGYAGDYEMVNMICRNPLEGSTLFAKIINLWFLRQPPAQAHRNRIQYLVDRLTEVTLEAARRGRPARMVSIGCGPAQEVQRFVSETHLSDKAQFTLIDFNEETAEHTRAVLSAAKHSHQRATNIDVVRKSVNQILKEAGRTVERPQETQYDLVYCAGLFDYLPDSICRRLSEILYEWVAPGGQYLSTNVDASNPRRLTMDYIMDWHLIYRSGSQLAALGPEQAAKSDSGITSDLTGVNIYYIARKQKRG